MSRTAAAALVGVLLPACVVDPDSAGDACLTEERALQYGFYADYEPVSHSADPAPGTPGHDRHMGFEADLLTALEAMDGTGVVLDRHAIDSWPDIWLRPARGEYDFVGGGISILDSRTRNDEGETVTTFTSGHITFRQSLLVRTEDAERLRGYDDLADARVAVLLGTTGEHRLLELTGVVDGEGTLAAGTIVYLADGSSLTADGSAGFRITAAGSTANVQGRTRLEGPEGTVGAVLYYSTAEAQVAALRDRVVDAVAGDQIGNQTTAARSDGTMVITALDAQVELGGFAFPATVGELAACIDERLLFLTNNRGIGIGEWLSDAGVFMARAGLWSGRQR